MNVVLCRLRCCKMLRIPYDKILRTAFDANLQQRLQFVKQNFSKLISSFIKSFRLMFMNAFSKQTVPNFGQVSTAECLAREVCISQGCGKKSYILADISGLAKLQAWMQLCRQKRTYISFAYVVWGGDATMPAEKPLPLACAVQRRRLCQHSTVIRLCTTEPSPVTATGKEKPLWTKEIPL